MMLRNQEKSRQRKRRMRLLVCEPPPHMRSGGGNNGNVLAKQSQRKGGINPRNTAHGWARFMRKLMSHEFNAQLVVVPAPHPPLYDTTFPRDTYFVGPDGKIHRVKMAAEYRRSDPFYICSHLQALGLDVVDDMNYVMDGRSCFHVLPNETAIVYCASERADPRAAEDLRRIFGIKVLVVELVPKFFFHGDVAGMTLTGKDPAVFWCRESLVRDGDWDLIQDACKDDKSEFMQTSYEDALRYAMNTRVMNGYKVIAPPGMSTKYIRDVHSLGYEVCMLDLGPLHKECGGFVACATNDFPDTFYDQRIPLELRGEVAIPRFEQNIRNYPKREMVVAQT